MVSCKKNPIISEVSRTDIIMSHTLFFSLCFGIPEKSQVPCSTYFSYIFDPCGSGSYSSFQYIILLIKSASSAIGYSILTNFWLILINLYYAWRIPCGFSLFIAGKEGQREGKKKTFDFTLLFSCMVASSLFGGKTHTYNWRYPCCLV